MNFPLDEKHVRPQMETWGQFNKTFTSVAFVIKLQNNGHNCKLHL